MNKFRVLSNGVRYKIQRKSTEGIFFKTEVWNDLGRISGCMPGILITKYYNTLEEVKMDYERFVEHDKKLTEWSEIVL